MVELRLRLRSKLFRRATAPSRPEATTTDTVPPHSNPCSALLTTSPKSSVALEDNNVDCKRHHIGSPRTFPQGVEPRLVGTSEAEKGPLLFELRKRIADKLPLHNHNHRYHHHQDHHLQPQTPRREIPDSQSTTIDEEGPKIQDSLRNDDSESVISEEDRLTIQDSIVSEPLKESPALTSVEDAEVVEPRQIALVEQELTPIQDSAPPQFAAASDSVRSPAIDSHQTEMTISHKVWVKRPGAAATIVSVKDDYLVDEAKDLILRKYGNSLGRHFDAPDVTLRVKPRESDQERVLNPDENLWKVIEKTFPGGQIVEEALIIHVPQRRTPRQSPGVHFHHQHHAAYHSDDGRPRESGTDYFPPMPAAASSPGHSAAITQENVQNHAQFARSLSVLTTGQVPALVSPGGRRAHANRPITRPGYARQHTASPTTLNSTATGRPNRPRVNSTASSNDKHAAGTTTPALTPPVPTDATKAPPQVPPRVASPRPSKTRKLRQKQPPETLPVAQTFMDASVPPINVLIVEDNTINMRLLEQFVRRLKVHWATAVNGREAVQKWRQGGFHLVLMDIQLPIMSGLDATREIRRLERVNNIGVMSSSASSTAPDHSLSDSGEVKEEDKLGDSGRLFKSPVIIVALTASSLQSDRHEALAAGCNDFLTKPVNFVWFERKVKEWGCMQALIDFDGWRKWKDAAIQNGLKNASNLKQTLTKNKSIAPSSTIPAVKESNALGRDSSEELTKRNSSTTAILAGHG